MMQQLTTYFPFLASFGLILGFWGQIKVIAKKIFNLFILEIEVKGYAIEAIETYFLENGKHFTLGKFCYNGIKLYVKPVDECIGVIQRILSKEPQFFWLNNNLYILTYNQPNSNNSAPQELKCKIYCLKYTQEPDSLLISAINYTNKYRQEIKNKTEKDFTRFEIIYKRGMSLKKVGGNTKYSGMTVDSNKLISVPPTHEDFYVNKPLIWQPEDIFYGKKTKPDTYVFTKEAQNLVTSVKQWKESHNWYEDRDIPWRRGCLIHGLPGSGKTSCVRKIVEIANMPLYVFDLSTMDNQELSEFWAEICMMAPCAVLFEDIDNIYNKRQKVNKDVGPSFDCLLNCLSGALPAHGVFVFITTNKIECLDEALGVVGENGISSRPGRIDVIVRMDLMIREDRERLAKIILKGFEDKILDLVDKTEGYTAAQCSDLFAKVALEEYWKTK